MTVISLKDYAKQNNISYEAVRQQVVRYADELGIHIIKDGRQQFLDEEAVAFLDGKRQKNPVAIIQMDKDEQLEVLRNEKEDLLTKVAVQADKIAALAEWKADNAVAIAEASQNLRLLAEGKEKINALEAQNAVLSAEKEAEKAKTLEAQNDAQKASKELTAALQELEAEKTRKISFKEFWQRRK